jgi:hypothetical protein
MTFRVTAVVCVLPPPVAVTVMVWLPTDALLPTVIFIVDAPDTGAAMVLGLKDTVLVVPCPEADKVTVELKPPLAAVVMVTVPEERLAIVIEVGEAETVKPAVTPLVTVSETVVLCVRPPPVPVIVMVYVPAEVVEATLKVAVELPDPGAAIEDGLKLTVTPLGAPDAVSVTTESNPFDTVLVIVDAPLLPAATESEVGEAERLKDGFCDDEPVSALMRPVFGLPHPVTRSYPVTAE